MTRPAHDVAVIGGGPGRSTTAGFLARAGLGVALYVNRPVVGEASERQS